MEKFSHISSSKLASLAPFFHLPVNCVSKSILRTLDGMRRQERTVPLGVFNDTPSLQQSTCGSFRNKVFLPSGLTYTITVTVGKISYSSNNYVYKNWLSYFSLISACMHGGREQSFLIIYYNISHCHRAPS